MSSFHACTATTGEAKDFGLSKIAAQLGKSDAVAMFRAAAEKESTGDYGKAIAMYRKAFRLWPALDSTLSGGLPSGVRDEAEAAGLSLELGTVVDVGQARASRVVHAAGLLSASDLADIEDVRRSIESAEGFSLMENNPQNATHAHKECLFLNNAPDHPFVTRAPHVMAKLRAFAERAWREGGWGDDAGPLRGITGGAASLRVRVVEHWTYSVGGGLTDLLHYDTDSILTMVVLLNSAEEYEGGVFRTNEHGDRQLEHPLTQGAGVCFLSHKYHNVTPLERGTRRVLVMELWQGEEGLSGR